MYRKNNIITIFHSRKDTGDVQKITYDKDNISKMKIMFRKSKLEKYLEINEIQDNTLYSWTDIYKNESESESESEYESKSNCEYKCESELNSKIDASWDTFYNMFKERENGDMYETYLSIDDIINISSYSDNSHLDFSTRMSDLYKFTGSDFYDLFKKFIIIPDIMVGLNLDKIYEQLVFFEYLYCSSIYNLYDKIRWIIDNEYDELFDLIKEYYLVPKDNDHYHNDNDNNNDNDDDNNNNTYDDKTHYIVLLADYMYGGYRERVDKLMTIIHNHKEQIGEENIIFMTTMYEYSKLKDNAFYRLTPEPMEKLIQEHLISDDKNIMLGLLLEKNSDDDSDNKKIKKIYSDNMHLFKKVIRNVLSKYVRRSEYVDPFSNNVKVLDKYTMYIMIDLFVSLMEEDILIGEDISSYRSQILYEWLRLSSLVLDRTICRGVNISDTYISKYISYLYTRDIKQSDMIKAALENVVLDFNMMKHIYLKDNLEMFKILTKRCSFMNVDPIIVTYYPTNIMEYIQNMSPDFTLRDSTINMNLNILYRLDLERIKLIRKRVINKLCNTVEYEIHGIQTLQDRYEDILIHFYLGQNNLMYENISLKLKTLFSTNNMKDSRCVFDKYSNITIFAVISLLFFNIDEVESPNPMQDYYNYLFSDTSDNDSDTNGVKTLKIRSNASYKASHEFNKVLHRPDLEENMENLGLFKFFQKHVSMLEDLYESVKSSVEYVQQIESNESDDSNESDETESDEFTEPTESDESST